MFNPLQPKLSLEIYKLLVYENLKNPQNIQFKTFDTKFSEYLQQWTYFMGWHSKKLLASLDRCQMKSKMATDVALAWEVWELRFENPLSRIWLIVFMADISAIRLQRVKFQIIPGAVI